MGRRPTPTAILHLRGSWRARARERRAGIVVDGTPRPLPSVEGSQAAMAIFDSLVRTLQAGGVAVGDCDSFGLSFIASELAAGQIAIGRMVATGGAVVGGGLNPWRTAARAANDAACKMMADYGLTPRARLKLIEPEKTQD